MWISPNPSGLWTNQSMFGTDNSLLLQTLLSLFQDLLPTHQVSNSHSNLETTPASSIYLTSRSVHSLSLPFLCRIFLILDKLKIEMTKDSLYHAGKNGEHSYGENLCMLVRMGSIPVWRISMEII